MQVLNLSRTIYFRLFVKNKIENDCFAYWGKAREIEGFKMSFGTILTMAGGLGLFLFGMELMSDSIEKVAVPDFVVFWRFSPRTVSWG